MLSASILPANEGNGRLERARNRDVAKKLWDASAKLTDIVW